MYDTIEVVSSSAEKKMKNAGEDKDLSRVESAGVADNKDGAVNHLPRWRIVMMVSAAAFFLVLTTIIVWLTIVTEQQAKPQPTSALRVLNGSQLPGFLPDHETHPAEHFHPTTMRSNIDDQFISTTWIMTTAINEDHPTTIKTDVDDSHNEVIHSPEEHHHPTTVETEVNDSWMTEEFKDGEEEENGLENTTELVTRAEVEEEELEEDENGSGNFAEQPKVDLDEEHMDEDSVLFVATSPPVRILDEEEEEFEEDPIKEESLTDNIPDDRDDYNDNHEDVEAVLDVITDDIMSPSEAEESGSGMLLESTLLN